LEPFGISVVAKDLGGHQGSNVIFNRGDGSVLM
jgi:chemotaxis receptor (MCP) glutamine deamidase CheD